MAVSKLLRGRENWTVLKKLGRRTDGWDEILRPVLGYKLLGNETNEEIRQQLNIYQSNNTTLDYRH